MVEKLTPMGRQSFMKRILSDTSPEYVAKRLELFRKSLGMRQVDLAREFGWSQQKWEQWESAEEFPGLPDMIELDESYGVTLDFIFRGDMSHLPGWLARELRELVNRSPLDAQPHPAQGNNRVRLVAQWKTDENHRFITDNSRAADLRDDQGRGVMYRYSPIGRTRWEISDGNPDDSFWSAHIADLDARRPFKNFRYPLTTRAGRFVWIISTGHPQFEGEVFSGYSGLARYLSVAREVQQATG
jgi:transcriptional regulator with XRE-family HTH domain